MMLRRIVSSVCFGLVSILFSTPALPAGQRPNILLIMADDVGVDVLGCYGGTSYPTPRLDELAESGMRFRHCYSMPVCHPTRVCILSGAYPFRHGNPRWGTFPESAEKETFAHVLRDAGYATVIAGKWQLTMLRDEPDHPHRLGFDEYCLFGWHEGPRYYDPMVYQNGELREGMEGQYGPDVYTDFLIDFMQRTRERPFMAFYSMALCHDVTNDLKHPVPYGPAGHYDTYAKMAAEMDVRIGRLVDALDDSGLRENTLILFTTDNGTAGRSIHTVKDGKYVRRDVFSEFGGRRIQGGKGSLKNGGTNVPLIASLPGTIDAAQVVDDLVDFSDFLPMLADIGRADLDEDLRIDGISFAGRLLHNVASAREWAFAEHARMSWVRTQRWKLYADGRLFDMDQDPDEGAPIAESSQSDIAAAVRLQLQAALNNLQE